MPTRILAICVTFRSADHLPAFLASLERQEGVDLRLVVVDNSADAHTKDLVDSWAGKLQVEYRARADNPGYGAGVNEGLRLLEARDHAALVLNPDLTLPDGSVLTMAEALFGRASPGMVIPAYVDEVGRPIGYWTDLPQPRNYWRWAMDLSSCRQSSTLSEPNFVEWGPGSCMLARREAISQVGVMDERLFLYMEDADWCKRFLDAGWSVLRIPEPRIHHSWGHAGSKNLGRRVVQTHLAKLYYFEKWFGRRGLILAVFQMCLETTAKELSLRARHDASGRLDGYRTLRGLMKLAITEGPIAAQDIQLGRPR